jgi:hypothetical protein
MQSLALFIVNSDWPYYNFWCNVKQWFASCAYVLQWEDGCLGLELEVMAWNGLKQLGKNIAKRVTQVSGHFLKLHFCMLKKHKWSIIVETVVIVFGIFFINYRACMFKSWHKSKCFLCVQRVDAK